MVTWISASTVFLYAVSLWWNVQSASAANHIDVHTVEGVINPVVVEYMLESLERARVEEATMVVFQLDTPGGLVESTRLIVKALLNAEMPVVIYVAPSGACRLSGRTFITMAGHIAAMAPGTNIGAAHPVSGGGKDIEGDMRKKAENDLAAFARSIADKRGRNADWAEAAVRESVSITETAALEKHVIDLIADDVPALLAQLDGKTISIAGTEKTLRTVAAPVRYHQMSWRQQVLAVISHPQFALMLLSLGSMGLLLELYNPGLILSGSYWRYFSPPGLLFPANLADQLCRALAHWPGHALIHPGGEGHEFRHAHHWWPRVHVPRIVDARGLPCRLSAHSAGHYFSGGGEYSRGVYLHGRRRRAECQTATGEWHGRHDRRNRYGQTTPRPGRDCLCAWNLVERSGHCAY